RSKCHTVLLWIETAPTGRSGIRNRPKSRGALPKRTVGGGRTSRGGDLSVGAGWTDERLVNAASPSPKATAAAGSPSNHSTKSGGSSQSQLTGKIPHKLSFEVSAKKPGSSPRRKGWAQLNLLAE